jgi:hypothetical protein
MTRELCNTEEYGVTEAHYANRSSFVRITVKGKPLWVCEDCRLEIVDF